jgi:hypothetical protein
VRPAGANHSSTSPKRVYTPAGLTITDPAHKTHDDRTGALI